MKENEKNRIKNCIRFSVRLPKEQHKWLKNISNQSKGTKKFISMNDYISMAVEFFKNNY